jgi:hypothetical protein
MKILFTALLAMAITSSAWAVGERQFMVTYHDNPAGDNPWAATLLIFFTNPRNNYEAELLCEKEILSETITCNLPDLVTNLEAAAIGYWRGFVSVRGERFEPDLTTDPQLAVLDPPMSLDGEHSFSVQLSTN